MIWHVPPGVWGTEDWEESLWFRTDRELGGEQQGQTSQECLSVPYGPMNWQEGELQNQLERNSEDKNSLAPWITMAKLQWGNLQETHRCTHWEWKEALNNHQAQRAKSSWYQPFSPPRSLLGPLMEGSETEATGLGRNWSVKRSQPQPPHPPLASRPKEMLSWDGGRRSKWIWICTFYYSTGPDSFIIEMRLLLWLKWMGTLWDSLKISPQRWKELAPYKCEISEGEE